MSCADPPMKRGAGLAIRCEFERSIPGDDRTIEASEPILGAAECVEDGVVQLGPVAFFERIEGPFERIEGVPVRIDRERVRSGFN